MLTQMSSKEASGSISVVQRIHKSLSDNFIRSSQLGLYSLSYTFIHFQNFTQKYFRGSLLASLATCRLSFCIVYFLRFSLCFLLDSCTYTLSLYFIIFLVSFFSCYFYSFCPYIYMYIYVYIYICVCVCVTLKVRKHSLGGKNDHTAFWY